jgi:hypothetical protein
MFNSHVELSALYSGPNFEIKTPVGIMIGHKADLSGQGKSHVELGFRLPQRAGRPDIDHNLKVIVEADVTKLQISALEVQIKTPKSPVVDGVAQPYTLFVTRRKTEQNGEGKYELSAGLSNFQIDVNSRLGEAHTVAKALTGVDKNPVINAFLIKYTRHTNSKDNSGRSQLVVSKNALTFVNVEARLSYNKVDLASYTAKAGLDAKIKEIATTVEAEISITDSQKGQLKFDASYKADGLLRILLKIISVKVNSAVDTSAKKADLAVELLKLGDVKKVTLTAANAPIRSGPAGYEFDVAYSKQFASPTTPIKSGTGTVKFVWVQGKKVEAKLNVPSSLDARFLLNREKTEGVEIKSELQLGYSHLDDPTPSQREFKFFYNGLTTVGSTRVTTFNVLAKKGPTGADFDDVEKLGYLIDLQTKNTHLVGKKELVRTAGENSAQVKVQSVKIDWSSNYKNDLQAKNSATNADVKIRFPAMFSDPGKNNLIQQKFSYTANQASKKRTLTYYVESDNKYVNDRFKKLNVNYVREAVGDENALTLNVKVTKVDSSERFLTVKVDRKSCEKLAPELAKQNSDDEDDANELGDAFQLCQGGKISIKQDIVPRIDSRIAPGKTFDITDCQIETKLVRASNVNYLFENLISVVCKDVKLYKEHVIVNRDGTDPEQPKGQFKLELQSDVYFNNRLYQLLYKRPRSHSAQFEVSVVRAPELEFTQRLSYERTVDEVSGQLVSGKYRVFSVKQNADGNRYERILIYLMTFSVHNLSNNSLSLYRSITFFNPIKNLNVYTKID